MFFGNFLFKYLIISYVYCNNITNKMISFKKYFIIIIKKYNSFFKKNHQHKTKQIL